MTISDQQILSHLSALSQGFIQNTFDLDRFLELLEADEIMAASHMFSGGSWLDHHPGEPDPGQICFPNGLTDVLLLKHEDSHIETDDPHAAQYAAIELEDECPLLLQMNWALGRMIEKHPDLEELDKFPYHPISTMLSQLFTIESAAMRKMIKAAIRRVFLERPESYFIRSPR